MQTNSALFGELEYEEQDIVYFPAGIPAFENEHRFIIIPGEEGTPFFFLQSLGKPELCLIITQPFIFFPNYTIEINDEDQKMLDCQGDKEKLLIYVVLTIPEDFKQSTANLLAPIIINHEKRIGMQYIAVNSKYNTRHYIFAQSEQEIAATAQEG